MARPIDGWGMPSYSKDIFDNYPMSRNEDKFNTLESPYYHRSSKNISGDEFDFNQDSMIVPSSELHHNEYDDTIENDDFYISQNDLSYSDMLDDDIYGQPDYSSNDDDYNDDDSMW